MEWLDFQVWRPWGVNGRFSTPLQGKVSDVGSLESLEGLEMAAFSSFEAVEWSVDAHFGGLIKEKVSI